MTSLTITEALLAELEREAATTAAVRGGDTLVYLRLLDVPVPSVYGPTADESPFRPATAGGP